jgi:hypothetical protein
MEPGSADVLADRLARLITRWGLAGPAIALLGANRPLSFVGSQAVLMLQPITDLFVSHALTSELAGLLAERDGLDRLVARLEESEAAALADRMDA